AHFQEIVEASCNHVAFLDFAYSADRLVEFGERFFAGIGQRDFCKSDVIEPELLRVDHSAKSLNVTIFDEPLQTCIARCLGQADLRCEFRDRNAAILRDALDDPAIESVKMAIFWHLHENS